jgi:hypothetical protein
MLAQKKEELHKILAKLHSKKGPEGPLFNSENQINDICGIGGGKPGPK